MPLRKPLIALLLSLFLACNEDSKGPSCLTPDFTDQFTPRTFRMGFSTWSFGPELGDVESTYSFIRDHSDIYSEQMDGQIPWKSWINNTPLPGSFTENIAFKLQHRLPGRPLLLSVSLLNTWRNELVEDFDGSVPAYQTLNDTHIREAYLKHVRYLVDQFSPDYLVFAMEVNELLLKVPDKWNDYKSLAQYVRTGLRAAYPNLKISESITLHSWYDPVTNGVNVSMQEIKDYAALSDFTAISFYAFLCGLDSRPAFQQAFDFLHAQAAKPIAVVETCYIAENLSVPAYSLNLPSDECEQNSYLETLLENAQEHNYEFVTWWTHRDYDKLWEIFPSETRDIGLLWRDTGLLNEGGKGRAGLETWRRVFAK